MSVFVHVLDGGGNFEVLGNSTRGCGHGVLRCTLRASAGRGKTDTKKMNVNDASFARNSTLCVFGTRKRLLKKLDEIQSLG